MDSIQQALFSSLSQVFTDILRFLPSLLSAFVVVIIGSIIANWLKSVTVKLLKTLPSKELFKKFNFKLKFPFEEFAGRLVKWLVLLLFIVAATNLLGLTAVSQAITQLLGYLPHIISALVVLFIGILLSGLVESLVKGALSGYSVATARLVSKIASYIILVFSILAAISELQIAANFIYIFFIGFITTLSLALGLAFGLGSKDLVNQILSDWYKGLKKKSK